ncbi:hypothetical protein N7466_011138 [Penicillium verhagenii]|uniref:uncharacterized protein n=1 Tax=Penicillium verhagenii TaxID=1562060 RepID=UPI0025452F25|nr:uncharacterized protein N7466_011138 [Penicillium verhagenii]KAJ5917584.1 hypothetical protein N7466_011138 [Penicillium verhagenii]
MVRSRAGTLAVINMGFLFLAHHLAFLGNILGIPLVSCKRMHQAAGWMTGMLLALHVLLAMIVEENSWTLSKKRNLFAFIVSLPPHSMLITYIN